MNNLSILELLHLIERDGTLSQRAMAEHLGVALGLVNGLLSKCLEDGFLVANKDAHRHQYALTSKGIERKSALVSESLSDSFHILKKMRNDYEALFKECERLHLCDLVLVGVSELSTLATLAAKGYNVRISTILSKPEDLKNAQNYDAIVVCDLENPQGTYDALLAQNLSYPLFVPAFLYIHEKAQDLKSVTL